jgi:uncharacterized damage-inducible protein DinB
MKHTALTIFISLIGAGAVAFAQNPISDGQKFLYTMSKNNITRAAEKMPEENYAFKPTADVRSFGQLIGHVADAQYLFCSAVLGKKSPSPNVEKSKTTKADLVQALKEAFAYCDAAYDGMTDAQAAAQIKFFGQDQAKVTVLSFNSFHNNEHYGNIVTYMRLKGLVPPSSEKRQ